MVTFCRVIKKQRDAIIMISFSARFRIHPLKADFKLRIHQPICYGHCNEKAVPEKETWYEF